MAPRMCVSMFVKTVRAVCSRYLLFALLHLTKVRQSFLAVLLDVKEVVLDVDLLIEEASLIILQL